MNTVDFVRKCIKYYGYKTKEIQTDNEIEFTYNQAEIKKEHPMTVWGYLTPKEKRAELMCV